MSKSSRNTGRNLPKGKRPKPGKSIYKGDVRDQGLEDPRHWLDVSPDKPEHPLGFDYLDGPTEASKSPSAPEKVERPD